MGLMSLSTTDMVSAEEIFTYARETPLEKTICGFLVGVGFIYYRCQEEADETIQTLLAGKVCHPLLG